MSRSIRGSGRATTRITPRRCGYSVESLSVSSEALQPVTETLWGRVVRTIKKMINYVYKPNR